MFTLHLKEDVNEDGSLKPAAIEALKERKMATGSEKEADVTKDGDYQEARKQFEKLDVGEKGNKEGEDGGVD